MSSSSSASHPLSPNNRSDSGTEPLMDRDGLLAASGSVNKPMLAAMLDHEYLSMPPPKTTGREVCLCIVAVSFEGNVGMTVCGGGDGVGGVAAVHCRIV